MISILLILALGQSIVLRDEGTRLGPVTQINCVGSGIVCAVATGSVIGTITVAGGGGASPLTTKGDLFTYSTADARLPTAADGLCLKTLTSTSTGLEWGTCGTGAAPDSAPYVTFEATASLSAERVLTNGTNTTVDIGTAAQAKINLSGTVAQSLGGTGAGALSCSAGQVLTSNGTAYSCTTATMTNTNTGDQTKTCGAGEFVSTLAAGTGSTCTAPAAVAAYATVQEEGGSLTQRSTLNFVGASITCADTGGVTVCTVTSGGGSGESPFIRSLGSL